MTVMKNRPMDDKETLNRRARLRELIRECFDDEQINLIRHIHQRTGKMPNQGELSALVKDHNPAKSFGDKKGKTLTEQIGLNRRWFDMPLGTNLEKSSWLLDLSPIGYTKPDDIGADLPSNVEPGPAIRGEVPLISWVQAGEFQSAVDNYAPGQGAEMVPTTVPVKRHTYALIVKNDSMTNPNGWPSFPEGMVIIVEPDFDPIPGDFVIVKNGREEATFKQLILDGSDWYIKPLNPRYPIKQMTDDLRIVGVVRGYGGLLR